MNYYPIDNQILIQSLVDAKDNTVINGKYLDFDAVNPMKTLVDIIAMKPEIDYDSCSDLLFDLLDSFLTHLKEKFSDEEVKNIVMFNKKILLTRCMSK